LSLSENYYESKNKFKDKIKIIIIKIIITRKFISFTQSFWLNVVKYCVDLSNSNHFVKMMDFHFT